MRVVTTAPHQVFEKSGLHTITLWRMHSYRPPPHFFFAYEETKTLDWSNLFKVTQVCVSVSYNPQSIFRQPGWTAGWRPPSLHVYIKSVLSKSMGDLRSHNGESLGWNLNLHKAHMFSHNVAVPRYCVISLPIRCMSHFYFTLKTYKLYISMRYFVMLWHMYNV
jgi:hypothetical protein